MSTDMNKALVHRLFEEGVNNHNARVIDELVDATYVNYSFPAPAPGAEGFKQVIGMFQAGFPDMQVTVEDAVAEGNRVATRGYFTGTHQGAFMGIAATGKSIKVSYSDVWRIGNGKAVENWVQMDQLGMMQQLGVIPTPG